MASAQYLGEPSLVVIDSDLEPRDKWIELGRGAFSVVYKAFCQLHNDHVAVKEIKRGNELHEIQKLVKLSSHDHVVKIKAVLEMPGGKSGIIMEFCEYGLQSLRDTLGSNFIPWPRCLIFMQHIMSGLQFLHRNNITHRDLKPENVMVTKSFKCKIADVGLAKAYHSRSNSASSTQIVCPSGTPFYISPERWRHPTAVGTQQDDIYSCGILFYKMITNADLFYMEEMVQDDSFFSMLKMYVAEENYRPEISELDKGSTPAPPIVKAVITTCWDEKPENRKTFNYWTNMLREEIKNNYSREMIDGADEELRWLLHTNGATVSKKKSSVKDKRPQETKTLDKSLSSSRKQKPDQPYSSTSLTVRPSLQPLKSQEDDMRKLSLQENVSDLHVIVLHGMNAASCYGLELDGSYSLTSDTQAKELHFKLENGKVKSISFRNIYSHSVDVPSDIVYLNVWAGRELEIQPLTLSASSAKRMDRMLKDITGNTEVEGKPLQTNGNFNGYPSGNPPPSLYNSHPMQMNPGVRHWPPAPVSGPAYGGTSITIGYVDKFYSSGHDGQSLAVSLPPPYPVNQLTGSEEMVTDEDTTDVASHIATKYDAVSRLMGLESQSKIIRLNNRDDIEEASYKLIQAWIQALGSDATKKALALILYKAKLYDAAKQL